MNPIGRRDRILGGLWGAIVGDVLGVPVEFRSREERKADPVKDVREYGTFHQPKGTWSDDSSLMLCTVESLINGFDSDGMADLFIRWLSDAYWTPWGETFDAGGATMAAIGRMVQGVPPEQAGGISERDNGNGSLMRILPIGLYFAQSSASEIFDYAHRASSLTHRHPRSQMACGIYCLMVSFLLTGMYHELAYWEAVKEASRYYDKCKIRSTSNTKSGKHRTPDPVISEQ